MSLFALQAGLSSFAWAEQGRADEKKPHKGGTGILKEERKAHKGGSKEVEREAKKRGVPLAIKRKDGSTDRLAGVRQSSSPEHT